ncbi:MAG: zinc transporter ZntB [Alphaproteobacteria bacterium]|nr:zinc transporter ZntB [Alphaproteobacteria bacterium]
MPDAQTFESGIEAGLRFAYVLDGRGGGREVDWRGVRAWSPADGVLWVHLERDDEATAHWMREAAGIDPVTCEALLAEESRPRVECNEDALLVVLRGVDLKDGADAVDLAPVHLSVTGTRVISLRDKDDQIAALRDIRKSLAAGQGPRGAGELFAQIAAKIVRDLEPVLDKLEDSIDALDERLAGREISGAREALSAIRRQAIGLRRYLAPQREALFRLHLEEATWLARADKIRLREVTDRTLRYVESLDEIRDRATVLHEDIAAVASERTASATVRLTALTALLLPPTLLAGLLGANVSGIPFSDDPAAFAATCLLVVVMLAIEVWILRRSRWL